MLFALILFFSSSVLALENQDNEAYAKQMVKKLELEDFHNLSKNIELAVRKLPATGKGCKDCAAKVQNLEPIRSDDKNGILVFVSFSLPTAALIELNRQAPKYKARLILRGIHQNSFTKTKDRILEIEPKGLTIDVDPQLFKQYKITRVPTFILLRDGKEVNRLSGNVTLAFAHKKLVEVSK